MISAIGQVRKSKVEIKNDTEVTESLLREGKPDYVILATGGQKVMPPVTGIDQPFVCIVLPEFINDFLKFYARR